MAKYTIRRLLVFIPSLLFITFTVYLLLDLAPGDPLAALVNPEKGGLSEATREIYKRKFGLDKPFLVRYFFWLKALCEGDFGYSTVDFQPVSSKLKTRISRTSLLAALALVLGTLLGIMIGILSAIKQYSLVDYVVTLFAFLGISLPEFFSGALLIYVFAFKLNLLPAAGIQSAAGGSFSDRLAHIILPLVTLSIGQVAAISRYMRMGMLGALSQEFITTALAKGASGARVIWSHAFRNAVRSVVTVISLRLRLIVTGAILVETVFSWPGMGTLFIDAVHGRDYPVVMAILLLTAVTVLFSNLLVDLIYGLLDPRVRYE